MKLILLFSLIIISSSAYSNKPDQTQFEIKDIQSFFAFEGLTLFNSLLAASEPKAFGAVITLLSPLAISEKTTKTTQVLTLSGTASIGMYNLLELSSNKYSKGNRFKQNFIAFNLLELSAILSEKLTNQSDTTIAITTVENTYFVSLNQTF